ncbi:MAG: hypothetical protein CVU86_06995 [Firmicutes bacterium HGW-Firmicutes-11]|jgi:hypothetical protein|nr:MAG: hypothetical protein CVU94_07960 [Firmicutes bacterium HGW-Firmicutes-19]PKM84471.1 MAG: hypothetical protein CVU86_06995 [Firmicutes bacterium HGW-Firmicutes-11]
MAPRIYAPNDAHESNYVVPFVEGVAALDDGDTKLAWFTAKGYEIVSGTNRITPIDRLPFAELIRLAPFVGVNPANKEKFELVALIEAAVKTVYKLTIAAFDAIANVSAGTVAVPLFADAAAVIAALPTSVKATLADGTVATVPVTTWVDTDTYDPAVAASYTFTATLGTIPAPFATAVTASVEVVVAA